MARPRILAVMACALALSACSARGDPRPSTTPPYVVSGDHVCNGTSCISVSGLRSSVITSTQRTVMDEKCLGWDCSTVTQDNYRGKDGLVPAATDDGAMVAFAGIIAGVVPVVMAANSPPPYTTWFQVMEQAISDATTH